MLTLERVKEIEAQKRDIDIIFDDEALFHLGFELPSADELQISRCKPAQNISVVEISAQDPFNFRELFQYELINLSKKRDRFKESKTFALKFAGVATLSGELDKAEIVLQEAIKNNPDSRLLNKLGDTQILQGKDDKAKSTFEQSDLSSDLYSNLRIAYVYAKSNDLSNAMKYLENARKIDPTDFRHQMFMGLIHLNNGQCELAIRNFRVASETKRNSSALYVNLAASHWSLGHTEKTAKELKKAIAVNPLNENALIFYADVMFSIKCNEKAISPLEFYVKLNQKSKFAWERLARAYYFTGKYTKARHALENQIAIHDEPSAYNNLGLVHWKLNNDKIAFKCLYKSIQDSKSDKNNRSIPLLNMAIALNERKHFKECYGILSNFVEQEHTDINDRVLCKIYIEYLSCLEGLEEYEKSTIKLNEFVRRDIKDVEGKALLLISKIYSDAVINNDVEECIKST
ncbi:lipopolysaccharide assembly protein LapB, partial [Geobacter sp. OR-1]|uniref:tetratricopeptide repeat protein n=1 Tax=Geobacter sp. OR-1 TaxID=1266765 RepID=UPI0005A764A9